MIGSARLQRRALLRPPSSTGSPATDRDRGSGEVGTTIWMRGVLRALRGPRPPACRDSSRAPVLDDGLRLVPRRGPGRRKADAVQEPTSSAATCSTTTGPGFEGWFAATLPDAPDRADRGRPDEATRAGSGPWAPSAPSRRCRRAGSQIDDYGGSWSRCRRCRTTDGTTSISAPIRNCRPDRWCGWRQVDPAGVARQGTPVSRGVSRRRDASSGAGSRLWMQTRARCDSTVRRDEQVARRSTRTARLSAARIATALATGQAAKRSAHQSGVAAVSCAARHSSPASDQRSHAESPCSASLSSGPAAPPTRRRGRPSTRLRRPIHGGDLTPSRRGGRPGRR